MRCHTVTGAVLALWYLVGSPMGSLAVHNPASAAEAASFISNYVASHPLQQEQLSWSATSPICQLALSQSSIYNSSDLGPSSAVHEQMDCLALSVPYSYSDLDDQRRAHLAIFRLVPSEVRWGKRQSKGRIFVNPGGPGGSGSIFLAANWEHFLNLTNREYELIGWDQRGVGQSHPSAPICFQSGVEQARFEMDTQINVPIPKGAALISPAQKQALHDDVGHSLDRYTKWKNSCVENSSKESMDFLPFIGTFYTALDLEYMRQLLAHHDTFAHNEAASADTATPGSLHYWGISYGTTIAQLYMAMFPDKCGRFILDGVVNASSSLHNPLLRQSIGDQAEAVLSLHSFYQECVDAGPAQCVLAALSNDPTELAELVDDGLRAMYEKPLDASSGATTFEAGQSLSNGSISLPQLEARVLTGLMSPASRLSGGYATLSRILKGAADGDANAVYAAGFRLSLDPASAGNSTTGAALPESSAAIVCQDAPSDASVSTSQTIVQWLTQKSIPISRYFDPVVLPTISCSSTGLDKAHERWEGALPMDDDMHAPLHLPNPLLIVGNALDPSTAGAQARALHRNLANSSYLLNHHGAGHTSWAQPSTCTHEAVRHYWASGTLPASIVNCSTGLWPLFGEGSPFLYF